MKTELVACPDCGAPDGRDAEHRRGCPILPPVPHDELLRIALDIEAGWRRKEKGRPGKAHAAGAAQ